MSDTAAYAAYRTQVISSLRGRVLEIGAGTGRNQALLPPGVTWQGLEPDRRRHARLVRNARHDPAASPPLHATAEDVPLAEESVDGVLSIATLCSVSDPEVALSEVRRVLRRGGRLVFAEHVAAPPGTWTRTGQRVLAPLSVRFDHGCDPLRDTEETVRRSGLEMREIRRYELPQPFGLRIPYVVGVAVR